MAQQRDAIFKRKVNDCVQHILLQKFTNLHAIRSWNFRIFVMRWRPRFFAPPCTLAPSVATTTATATAAAAAAAHDDDDDDDATCALLHGDVVTASTFDR